MVFRDRDVLDCDIVKEMLGLDEGDYLLTVLPMGYIKGNVPQPTLRKSLNQITREV